jgi:membrane protein implicated in regulation of membrane protease activity
MAWWLWLLLGLALLASEAFTPGAFFVFFFGLSALAVGLAARLGGEAPGWFQWFLFSLLSIGSLAFLRGPLLKRIMPVQREALAVDSMVGEVAVPLEELSPGAVGKAELRGTTWTAKNVDVRALARGERSLVVSVDGLVLSLRGQ